MSRRKSFVVGACFLLLCATASLVSAADRSPDGVWTHTTSIELRNAGDAGLSPWIQPQNFQAARVSAEELGIILDQAPMEFSAAAKSSPAILTLPTPDGGFETFELVESPVMAPGLEAWMASQGWPMRTYRGVSLDHPATNLRLDWGGPAGFHASVLSPGRSYYMDPYWKGNTDLYTSYFRSGYVREHDFSCLVESEPENGGATRAGSTTNGDLRTYRLVVAATGEYTAFHGGTQAEGQAAIVTTINRVNQVYENDLSIRMTLVGNNNLVVYENGGTDPYTNNDGFAMLTQNQTTCDSVIGTSNYDIGHVVSTGGGGIASLGVPCNGSFKARGVTGSGAPVGDPFDIDYVAHEMGHQWGGHHTFNSSTSSCGGGNRNASTAYEPGSGSTIQAYAGICGTDNLQGNSDPYFHGVSLDEMLNYAAGNGACSVDTSAGNPNAPTVDAGLPYTIPVSTPFELTVASSNDPDGGSLTYTWEEFDLGVSTTLGDGDNGSSPILRSWSPSTSLVQTFPHNGMTPAAGETLPTTNRAITFRLTVRDNHGGGGRVGEDTTTITATTTAGPFAVTAPNGGESWNGAQIVTWNVAGTNSGSVNTANVDIMLSTDGGATFPTTLLAATPNDGSESVTLPTVNTNFAQIKIKGSGNVFYDTSDANFTIGAVVSQTLYDQSTDCSTGASTSQYFSDFGGGSEAADDFVVPAGQQWTLGNVVASGLFSATGPLTGVNVFVWSDAIGLPGSIVSGCSFLNQTPVGGLSDPEVSVDLPDTCLLDPGTYWLEVQPVMPFNPNGQWYWFRSNGTAGAEFAFRDTGDLFGTGCTAWTVQSGCLDPVAETELCFSISGSPGNLDFIFEDGFEDGTTDAW